VPPIPVVIAVPSPLHAALIGVAAEEGLFSQEGLLVTTEAFSTGPLALAAMRQGRADLATCAETVAVLASLRGQPVTVLASIASATKVTALVARHPGIAGPSDLGGKRVGLPRGTTAEFFLDSLLVRHGVDRSAVQVVDMKPAAEADALANGDVDAIAIWEPYVSLIRKRLGDTVRVFHVDDIYVETHDLVCRPGFAKERPDIVGKVLRALLRAEVLLRGRPELARQSVQLGLKRMGHDVTAPEVDAMVALLDFRVRLDQGLLLLMEEEARWAIRSGVVPPQEVPNFLPLLDAEPLRSVNPEAVQLMR
jgi:ABC-type nitrate/sulfonate/bicarbonate transport system substrate-binding protein